MSFGLVSVLVALLAAVALNAGWCGGTAGALQGLQFGLLMGVFVVCVHPISSLNYNEHDYNEHGQETWARNCCQ
jgi:hypothetical protein